MDTIRSLSDLEAYLDALAGDQTTDLDVGLTRHTLDRWTYATRVADTIRSTRIPGLPILLAEWPAPQRWVIDPIGSYPALVAPSDDEPRRFYFCPPAVSVPLEPALVAPHTIDAAAQAILAGATAHALTVAAGNSRRARAALTSEAEQYRAISERAAAVAVEAGAALAVVVPPPHPRPLPTPRRRAESAPVVPLTLT